MRKRKEYNENEYQFLFTALINEIALYPLSFTKNYFYVQRNWVYDTLTPLNRITIETEFKIIHLCWTILIFYLRIFYIMSILVGRKKCIIFSLSLNGSSEIEGKQNFFLRIKIRSIDPFLVDREKITKLILKHKSNTFQMFKHVSNVHQHWFYVIWRWWNQIAIKKIHIKNGTIYGLQQYFIRLNIFRQLTFKF